MNAPGAPQFMDEAASIVEALLAQESPDNTDAPVDATLAAASLPISIPEHGVGDVEATRRLREILLATPHTAGPRFANQLFAGRERLATLADMLASFMNNSMYTYKAAGPQVLVEREVLERMLAKACMPAGDAMFTPGGSLSNLACMIVARNEMIPDARDRGFDGRRRTVYVSSESHYSITKNANMIGIGRDNVRPVEVDRDGRMLPDKLADAIAHDKQAGDLPMMIVATSGTTVMGAFDPLDAIADVAQRESLWLHVDGAYGGTALMNPDTAALMKGIERADSLAWDAHKMMGVPLICSGAFTREPGLMSKHFNETASYLFQQDFDRDGAWMNPGTRSLQCGRRNDALKLWAQWQSLGDDGYAARIDRQLALARHAVELVNNDDRLTLSFDPAWTNICFEVTGKDSHAICTRLNDEGTFKVGHGIVHGRRVIRLVTVDASLQATDIDRMMHDITEAGRLAPEGDNAVA